MKRQKLYIDYLNYGKIEEDDIEIDYAVNKLTQDVIIVDEVSMVDLVLMNYLMKGIKDNAKLILIGDGDQLASVGPGAILNDLIDSESIEVIKLTEIYRQARDSKIVMNAHKINDGDKDIEMNAKDGDFFFVNETSLLQQLIELICTRLPKMREI